MLLRLVALVRILVLSEGWTATRQVIAVSAMVGILVYGKYVLTVAIVVVLIVMSATVADLRSVVLSRRRYIDFEII